MTPQHTHIALGYTTDTTSTSALLLMDNTLYPPPTHPPTLPPHTHTLHLKHLLTNGRYSGNNLAKFQLVQDGGLASRVQTNHQNSHLLFPKETLEKARECPHLSPFLLSRSDGRQTNNTLPFLHCKLTYQPRHSLPAASEQSIKNGYGKTRNVTRATSAPATAQKILSPYPVVLKYWHPNLANSVTPFMEAFYF